MTHEQFKVATRSVGKQYLFEAQIEQRKTIRIRIKGASTTQLGGALGVRRSRGRMEMRGQQIEDNHHGLGGQRVWRCGCAEHDDLYARAEQ